jgi:hypothetical protein
MHEVASSRYVATVKMITVSADEVYFCNKKAVALSVVALLSWTAFIQKRSKYF